MASFIDPSLPEDGTPAVKADLRANLGAAKNEIEALQTSKADVGHDHAGEVLQTVDFRDYREVTQTLPVSGGTVDVDLGQGNVAWLTMDQDATGGHNLTWPASVRWPGGVAPALGGQAGSVDICSLFTVDGGATWFGMIGGQGFA